MTRSYALGALQQSGIEIYVLDPAHEPLSGVAMVGGRLVVDLVACGGTEALAGILVGAANSADASDDRELCEALTRLSVRVRSAEVTRK